MNDKEKKPKYKWLEKLKNIKHIEIYISIIFIVILLLIYLGNFKTNKTTTTKKESANLSEMNVISYVDQLETNLEEILSSIGGVSNVKVMITLDMANADVKESNINLSKFPDIKGVIVTANGVGNTATKLKVLHAVEAVIDIKNGNIEILSSD